jgi:ubiquitin-activating enzyme E1-like protein 2
MQFISSDVFGVFSSVFCDLGESFDVVDEDGEDYEEIYVDKIIKGNPGVVSIQEGGRHGLQDGDCVTFKEVGGMTAINGTVNSVKVRSPTEFSIGDISSEVFQEHTHGGIVQKVKVSKTIHFESLEVQLKKPDFLLADFAKPESPLQIHVALQGLHLFQSQFSALPRPRSSEDAQALVEISKEFAKSIDPNMEVDTKTVQQVAFTAQGLLPPLATAIGGIVAHEALISLTGKFTPLKQWLFADAAEILEGQKRTDVASFLPRGDRYDGLRVCLGEELLKSLSNQKLFMIGCGAIGCEMLKNYAMLGIGSGEEGGVTITDNDVIEKSNLNRQFLFRPQHIQQPKSTVAAAATRDINPGLRIEAQEYKVCPQSENVYTDEFFQRTNLVVNALDNVEARRYVDSRCVTNQRPLLESGTMGTKGHVQVIVPHLTECYSSQQDPPERDIPYCTLKSFPANIEHTIQWARDKFESVFVQDPEMYTKFWETHKDPQSVLKNRRGVPMDNVVKVVKLLSRRPQSWEECVTFSRIKFEKSYNHKARNLLTAFPKDHKLKNGSPFWQLPKRPPTPLAFDASNELHLSFVKSMSRLYADIWGVPYSQDDLSDDRVIPILCTVKVPEFKPSKKQIITDESVKKPQTQELSGDDVDKAFASLGEIVRRGAVPSCGLLMNPLSFEKDDDSNGHIDFITAASNLRAVMYSIDPVDRYKTKRIAGRIVPAIATTTAAVAGFVTIELIKVVMAMPLEAFKNMFLNLALPTIVFSEPAPPAKTVLTGGFSYTLWDKWEIRGHEGFKLSEFLERVKTMYRLEPSMVVHGVRMIYVPVMPTHRKRVTQTMQKLLKVPSDTKYVDLTLSFVNPDPNGGDDIAGPPIRYYFK